MPIPTISQRKHVRIVRNTSFTLMPKPPPIKTHEKKKKEKNYVYYVFTG